MGEIKANKRIFRFDKNAIEILQGIKDASLVVCKFNWEKFISTFFKNHNDLVLAHLDIKGDIFYKEALVHGGSWIDCYSFEKKNKKYLKELFHYEHDVVGVDFMLLKKFEISNVELLEYYNFNDSLSVDEINFFKDKILDLNDEFYKFEGNNRFSKHLYTYEEAEKLSRTLINCKDCINCDNCTNCISCVDCSYCKDCINCDNCNSCKFCKKCSYCNDCEGCEQCQELELGIDRKGHTRTENLIELIELGDDQFIDFVETYGFGVSTDIAYLARHCIALHNINALSYILESFDNKTFVEEFINESKDLLQDEEYEDSLDLFKQLDCYKDLSDEVKQLLKQDTINNQKETQEIRRRM